MYPFVNYPPEQLSAFGPPALNSKTPKPREPHKALNPEPYNPMKNRTLQAPKSLSTLSLSVDTGQGVIREFKIAVEVRGLGSLGLQ